MQKEETKDTYHIHAESKLGDVQIADDVVASIVGLAVTEVEGVFAMAGNLTRELIGKLGLKDLQKGVKITLQDNIVEADVALNILYGYNIPDVSRKVQEKVISTVESMTGLSVRRVRVKIADVIMAKNR